MSKQNQSGHRTVTHQSCHRGHACVTCVRPGMSLTVGPTCYLRDHRHSEVSLLHDCPAHVCRYACMHARTHARTHAFTHARVHVCTYASMHVCTYARMHVCMYACMYACMYSCMHGWISCMYVYRSVPKQHHWIPQSLCWIAARPILKGRNWDTLGFDPELILRKGVSFPRLPDICYAICNM